MKSSSLRQLFNRPQKNQIFIIADLGLTNGGSLQRALELIGVASELGVDAVKFQMLDSDELLGDKTAEYTYPTIINGTKTENMYKMFLGLEFNDTEWRAIKAECDKLGLGLIITCHVQSAVERLNKLDLPVNKICSWSLSHFKMIESLAQNGKPLILDTGPINQKELNEIRTFYSDNGGGEVFVLFDFHTEKTETMNFLAIKSLIENGYEVGYTPQGRRDSLDFMAIGLGANIIEKRLTLSRTKPENGHWKAHEPSEFAEWISHIKECYIALGEKKLTPTPDDLAATKNWYKSAWLERDVRSGELITEDAFTYKRPGNGITSKEVAKFYIGHKFTKNYQKGDFFEG